MVIAALLAWSSLRAWRAKNPLLKKSIIEMGWSRPGGSRLGGRCIGQWVADPRAVEAARAQRTPVSLNVAGTTEQIQRGQAISEGFCSDCHSTTGKTYRRSGHRRTLSSAHRFVCVLQPHACWAVELMGRPNCYDYDILAPGRPVPVTIPADGGRRMDLGLPS
jgi:hypothetical protein